VGCRQAVNPGKQCRKWLWQRLTEVFGPLCLLPPYRLMTPAERFDAAAMAFTRDRVLLAPAWISIGMEPDAVKQMPEWEEISAVAMAVHNMHLMACSLGLGGKWSSGATSRHPHVAQFLGLHPPAQLLGFLYVGKPATAWPTGQRRPLADKVQWRGNAG
jgi:nitroreductase